MKKETAPDGSIITGSEDVPTNLVVEPNRKEYRARIFSKAKEPKPVKTNRQGGMTQKQYAKSAYKGYFDKLVQEELPTEDIDPTVGIQGVNGTVGVQSLAGQWSPSGVTGIGTN